MRVENKQEALLSTEGAGNVGIQYVMESYYFSCAECQKVCLKGEPKK